MIRRERVIRSYLEDNGWKDCELFHYKGNLAAKYLAHGAYKKGFIRIWEWNISDKNFSGKEWIYDCYTKRELERILRKYA